VVREEDEPKASQIKTVKFARSCKTSMGIKHGTPRLYLSADVMLDPVLAFRKVVGLVLKVVPEADAYWSNIN
jgi:hypothetical protein